MDALSNALGDPVTDHEEEAFLVFSQSIPSQSLGFVDLKASVLDVSVGGRDLSIHQSPALLSSKRKEGTTGAVVWKVTPLFAEWISSLDMILWQLGFLKADSTLLELGTGVSGIVALTLAPKVQKYIATDQDYVLRLLKENVSSNTSATSTRLTRKKKSTAKNKQPAGAGMTQGSSPSTIELLVLDWELNSVATLSQFIGERQVVQSETPRIGVDVVIACDCIYNDALIEPFVSTCVQICRLRSEELQMKPTLCVVAQQLRSPDVFESWLKVFHRSFHVWRVPDQFLIDGLKENSGFVIHVGVLRED